MSPPLQIPVYRAQNPWTSTVYRIRVKSERAESQRPPVRLYPQPGHVPNPTNRVAPPSITKMDKKAKMADDLVRRDFHAKEPMTKRLNDMTEMNCKGGKLYLAATLDCFDGAIVGMKMDENKRAQLCRGSVESAIHRYGKTRHMIVHSDHGR